ncbi:MAG TPA: hypothetical protein VEO20_06635 [Thermoplasmata archaeon]|nr:hypothetical protein [Thermoplasmata archaeon]
MELEFHAILETAASTIFAKRPGALQVFLILRDPTRAVPAAGQSSFRQPTDRRRRRDPAPMPAAAG